jgi:D-3-phosphoglycerate dehydrogenase / 2-oxoglutarate reductase
MILINEPLGFPVASINSLQRIGPVHLKGSIYDADEIKIIFIRLDSKIDANFLDKFKSLKYIVSPTTGLTHLDLRELHKRNITIISLKGRTDFLNNIHATAEHTLALTLALLRSIPSAVKSVEVGAWNRYPFRGAEIHGRSVFLIGYGRVGRQVDRLYEAFGAKVMAFDTNHSVVPSGKKVTLEYGLKTAQIISVHISYSEQNIGFLSENLLSLLRPDAILINTSRGEILDQSALMESLIEKRLSGAALDVLCHEPMPLKDAVRQAISKVGDRLIVTPHIAGYTLESLNKVETYVTQLLIEDFSK